MSLKIMWHNEDVEYMDTSDTPWSWYYLADCGRWHKFEVNGFCTLLYITLMSLYKMCMNLIPLSELTPEYNTVAGYVKKDGLLDKHILSISRIQNLDLWEMYCCKKKQLMRIQGVKGIAERRLFHGTDPKNVDSICKYNFDVRLAGKHGSVYGKGVYFARHATYADNYSKDSTDPLPFYGGGTQSAHGSTRVIFLARVMIGRSTLGQRIFKKPDHGSLENNHESCVDDIKTPKCFVVFDSNQIYPEYLIQYR
uniref:Poly [ADP-ribose] polymerase n=1 Tax=Echeneis naucrates TaxID=173247 RepID=A0A665VXC2_ECHNA